MLDRDRAGTHRTRLSILDSATDGLQAPCQWLEGPAGSGPRRALPTACSGAHRCRAWRISPHDYPTIRDSAERGLFGTVGDAIVSQAFAKPHSWRGAVRPQQHLEHLAARLAAKGIVRPRPELGPLLDELVGRGLTRLSTAAWTCRHRGVGRPHSGCAARAEPHRSREELS